MSDSSAKRKREPSPPGGSTAAEDAAAKRRDKLKAWRLSKEQEKNKLDDASASSSNTAALPTHTPTPVPAVGNSVSKTPSAPSASVVRTPVHVGLSMAPVPVRRAGNRFGAKLGKAAGVEAEPEAEQEPEPGASGAGVGTIGVAGAGAGAEEEEEDPLDAFMRSLEGVDHITAAAMAASSSSSGSGAPMQGSAPSGGRPLTAPDTAVGTDSNATEAIVRPPPVDDTYSRDMLEEEEFLRSISSFGNRGTVGASPSLAGGGSDQTPSLADQTITLEDIMGSSGDGGDKSPTRGENPHAGGGWESDASSISFASHSSLVATVNPRLRLGGVAEPGYVSGAGSSAGPGGGGGRRGGSLVTTGQSDEDEDDEEEDRRRVEFIAAMRQKQFQLAEAERHQRDRIAALSMAPVHANTNTNTNISSDTAVAAASSTTLDVDGAAGAARGGKKQQGAAAGLGVMFQSEGDVVDEADSVAQEKGALELLEEAKKGKELKPVDHKTIAYAPFKKNLYIVPRALARLSEMEVKAKRDELSIKVRGKLCPAPVETWEQCGLSDRVLEVLRAHGLKHPFAIQRQSIPALMCGRDLIGVAKTGSGKTLAFLLPLFRHVLDQPPLKSGDGPIALIMAPARELAFQIRNEARKFCPVLGLRVSCIYGGVGVADQIAELKRGVELVVCTPGRMIDILTMQAGRMVPLTRVTVVVLDEADRMFDMGFEPQIRMIMQNVRPDRQTILFSATFPKQIEKLAKSILKHPLEIVVGERCGVNKDIRQFAEVREEGDKFMRLLQLLGIWYDQGNVIIFVDSQDKCDQLFQDLLKAGYPCVSLHGGKDQLDRDHTIYEFKSLIKTVMIATSVAGRGLDVPEIVCVINYACPNHYEDYVHRVGRTGRAGRKGTAYTFISSQEDQHAHVLVKAMENQHKQLKAAEAAAASAVGDAVAEFKATSAMNADHSTYVPPELLELAAAFKAKVESGDARFSSNSHVRGGKGFTFDTSELNEAQKLTSLQRREYNIEQGILDRDGKDDRAGADSVFDSDDDEDGVGGVDGAGSGIGIGGGGAGLALTTDAAPAAPKPNLNVTLDSLMNPGVAAANASAAALALAEVDTTNLTPMERALLKAKQAAMKVAATGRAGVLPPSSAAGGVSNSILLALDAAGMGTAGGGAAAAGGETTGLFAQELEFNEYPAAVRKKVTHRSSLEEVCDKYSVAIIPKGTYIAPNKTTSNASANMHLLTGSAAGKGQKDSMLLLGYTGITAKNQQDKQKEARLSAVAAAANPLAAAPAPKMDAPAAVAAAAAAVATAATPPTERKLYLLIEGKNEVLVKQAKQELTRMFNEELIAQSGVKDHSGRGGSMSAAGGGRYSVT